MSTEHLGDECRLDQTESRAAVRLRQREPDQVSGRECGPQLVVVMGPGLLERPEPIGVRQVVADPGGEVDDGLLVVGQGGANVISQR